MFRSLFLGNGWADCVEIWHALGDLLVLQYMQNLATHLCTCAPAEVPQHRASVSQKGFGLADYIQI